ILSFLFVALLATACGTSDATHAGHDNDAPTMESNEHEGQAGAVQLNNGQPWAANTETTDGVNSMLALLKGYDPASADTLLKSELVAEFNGIFAKCTMNGVAHEQLHNYLTPVHGMLDKLSAKPTAADLSELREYLGTYGNYFR
ncbi:MAG: hypothetical protein ABI373_00585, partial [Flavobacteriales bacterium]